MSTEACQMQQNVSCTRVRAIGACTAIAAGKASWYSDHKALSPKVHTVPVVLTGYVLAAY